MFAQTAKAARPRLTQGVQSGDAGSDGITLWSRADRPARMIVEHATTESFTGARRIEGPLALEETGFTSRLRLGALPPGQTIFYRIAFADPDAAGVVSDWVHGRFRTPATTAADVSFVWSADTVGQGWGINPDIGGMTIYETMRSLAPDFFVHCGDTIYADDPLPSEKKLPDGRLWKNLTTEAKSKVAETLDEFRGNHLYNLIDANLRRFNAEVPTIALWDDHDVVDNWYREKRLDADPRYREKQVGVLRGTPSAPFASSCHSPTGSTGRCGSTASSHSGRASISSASTCGASARPTGRTGRTTPARKPPFSVWNRSPG